MFRRRCRRPPSPPPPINTTTSLRQHLPSARFCLSQHQLERSPCSSPLLWRLKPSVLRCMRSTRTVFVFYCVCSRDRSTLVLLCLLPGSIAHPISSVLNSPLYEPRGKMAYSGCIQQEKGMCFTCVICSARHLSLSALPHLLPDSKALSQLPRRFAVASHEERKRPFCSFSYIQREEGMWFMLDFNQPCHVICKSNVHSYALY